MSVRFGIPKFAVEEFQKKEPFDHIVIDDFFDEETADLLVNEFPSFDSTVWHEYNNAIEIKKTCNDYNKFPPATYSLFSYLNSPEFIAHLSRCTGINPLFADPGLNGGGWHTHSSGGKLNYHLDYNIHPKIGLQRKLNLIVYLNKNWKDEWGGELGLWSEKSDKKVPDNLIEKIVPKFNRAVLFDTTQRSWHGLVNPVSADEGECRNSIAIYYLTIPPEGEENRGKALFAPTDDQKENEEILDLIKKRSQTKSADAVYKN